MNIKKIIVSYAICMFLLFGPSNTVYSDSGSSSTSSVESLAVASLVIYSVVIESDTNSAESVAVASLLPLIPVSAISLVAAEIVDGMAKLTVEMSKAAGEASRFTFTVSAESLKASLKASGQVVEELSVAGSVIALTAIPIIAGSGSTAVVIGYSLALASGAIILTILNDLGEELFGI